MTRCPICGREYCDHTSSERGQTSKEMMMSDDELKAKKINEHREQHGFTGCM